MQENDFLINRVDYKHDDNTINFDKFAKAFFSLLTKDNSMIYKQIVKQSYEQFSDIYKQKQKTTSLNDIFEIQKNSFSNFYVIYG